jgi:hypothetical protein
MRSIHSAPKYFIQGRQERGRLSRYVSYGYVLILNLACTSFTQISTSNACKDTGECCSGKPKRKAEIGQCSVPGDIALTFLVRPSITRPGRTSREIFEIPKIITVHMLA